MSTEITLDGNPSAAAITGNETIAMIQSGSDVSGQLNLLLPYVNANAQLAAASQVTGFNTAASAAAPVQSVNGQTGNVNTAFLRYSILSADTTLSTIAYWNIVKNLGTSPINVVLPAFPANVGSQSFVCESPAGSLYPVTFRYSNYDVVTVQPGQRAECEVGSAAAGNSIIVRPKSIFNFTDFSAQLYTKPPVYCATTGNIAGTYTNNNYGIGARLDLPGTITAIDGIALDQGSTITYIIALVNQTTPAQNGIYSYVGGDAVMFRVAYFDSSFSGAIVAGQLIPVLNGNVYGNSLLRVNTTVTFGNVGTSSITLTQLYGGKQQIPLRAKAFDIIQNAFFDKTAATGNLASYSFIALPGGSAGSITTRFPMPKSWNRSTLKVIIYWRSTATTGNVVLTAGALIRNPGDIENQAPSTTQSLTSATSATAEALNETAESSSITPSYNASAPTVNCELELRISRAGYGVGSDTLNADCRITGVLLAYTVNAGNDA